jgi:hypothetical protein
MTATDQESSHAQAARRIALEEVKARLAAITDTLSNSDIDAAQLHKNAEELNAVTSRLAWLADVSTARPLHLK